ncbi:hypothetical protein HYH02_014129 [Chlamydomonas schloesseri]|uniref:F-box domain-containing protein n=1 Tax=Chlamydomonas schloesseri TaxID=2026947 RepID=A0A835SP48_9CHLO|nr:hypothetical protein HYH02_014129 [Chlamydomonas schloesseri]|eukprot:KAG2429196.1 hypothetical protein HYH02_014129 [Chlamydomonas schloesseri]
MTTSQRVVQQVISSLAGLPSELRARLVASAGFDGAARLAQTCRTFRDQGTLARRENLATALRAAAGDPPQSWPSWLVAHAPQLRASGADAAELARLAEQGAAGPSDDTEAVRRLGQAVMCGELGRFTDTSGGGGGACAGGGDASSPSLLLRVWRAEVAAAARASAGGDGGGAALHLAALRRRLQAPLAPDASAAELPCAVGAIASLAEPAAAEGDPLVLGLLLVSVFICKDGQAEVLQQLLACQALVERLCIIVEDVCKRGQVEVRRQLLATRLLMDRIGAGVNQLTLQRIRDAARCHPALLQALAEHEAFNGPPE